MNDTQGPGGLGGLAGLQKKEIPPLPGLKFYSYFAVALASLMAADLSVIYSRGLMIPSGTLPARPIMADALPFKPRNDYNDIISRNIFNNDGLIPDVQGA